MSKKFYQTSQFKEVFDAETGEVIKVETTKEFTQKIDKDHFYMVYVDFISPLFQLNSDTAKSVLSIMCALAEYNTGMVILSTQRREDICATLKISPNTLTNSIRKLKDCNLISGEKGQFQINPAIHWKGDTKTRDQLMKSNSFKITFGYE